MPGRLALHGLEVLTDARLLITGGNGAGGSPPRAVLAGRLPAEGEVHRRRGLTVWDPEKPVGRLPWGPDGSRSALLVAGR